MVPGNSGARLNMTIPPTKKRGALTFVYSTDNKEIKTRYEIFVKISPLQDEDFPVVAEENGELRCGKFDILGWPPVDIVWEANCEEIPDVNTKVLVTRYEPVGGYYVMDVDAASVEKYKAKGKLTCWFTYDSIGICGATSYPYDFEKCTPVTTPSTATAADEDPTMADTGDEEDGGGDTGNDEETDTASNLLQNQRAACLLVLGHLLSQML